MKKEEQEHPLITAPVQGVSWTRDDVGKVVYYHLSDYACSGQRKTFWFVDGVIKHHRTFSEIVNTIIENGFEMEQMLEPTPSREIIEKNTAYAKGFHKSKIFICANKENEQAAEPTLKLCEYFDGWIIFGGVSENRCPCSLQNGIYSYNELTPDGGNQRTDLPNTTNLSISINI